MLLLQMLFLLNKDPKAARACDEQRFSLSIPEPYLFTKPQQECMIGPGGSIEVVNNEKLVVRSDGRKQSRAAQKILLKTKTGMNKYIKHSSSQKNIKITPHLEEDRQILDF